MFGVVSDVDHKYEYGLVPPDTLAVASAPETLIVTVGELTVIVIDAWFTQVPDVPVTLYVVVSVGLTTTLAVFVPLLSLNQLYDVAPEAVNVTLDPGHTVIALALTVTSHPKSINAVLVQPLASVTVTEYEPVVSPL